MFPSLNNAGLFYQFTEYYNTSREEDIEYVEESGLNRDISTIPFYNQVLNPNGDIIKIEETGINVYNIFGEKIKSIYDIKGNPVGVSVIGEDTYILSHNERNGELEAYYSPNNGIELIRMEGEGSDANIFPGIGVTSIHQINFFESLYYNDILFILNNNDISYTLDKINFNILNITFIQENILGISFLPNNDLYILTDFFVYKIEDFDINAEQYELIKLEENDHKFTIIKGLVGTIINAVSIPVNTTDDFDIDDMNIVTRILMYYNSSRLYYYWYSTHSEISIEMFENNIERLQELLKSTTNPDRIKTIEHCIERQEYFKSKIA
jgi:hypothetical protein